MAKIFEYNPPSPLWGYVEESVTIISGSFMYTHSDFEHIFKNIGRKHKTAFIYEHKKIMTIWKLSECIMDAMILITDTCDTSFYWLLIHL